MKSALLVLSHLLNPDRTLGEETLARAALAAHLYKQGDFACLATSGWAYRSDLEYGIGKYVANYLIYEESLPKSAVISDENSRDTVGDAFFLRKNVFRNSSISSVTVVTHDYHRERAQEIFSSFFCPEIEVQFTTVDSIYVSPAAIQRERDSLKAFRETFRDVQMHDDDAVWRVLSAKHPYYNGTIFH